MESDQLEACPLCTSSNLVNDLMVGLTCDDCGAVATAVENSDRVTVEPENDELTASWEEYSCVTNSTEKQIVVALGILEGLGEELNLPSEVRQAAAELYADAAIEAVTDGRPTETVIAGTVAIAGRRLEQPLPTGWIADVASVDVYSLRRTMGAIRRELCQLSHPCSPKAYVQSLASALDLDETAEKTAEEILTTVPSQQVGGRHPGAVAGAALYLAADGAITQREVARVTGVTTETVRLRVNACRDAWRGRRREEDTK